MKPIAELLRYLSHPAITEIALTTGRCPMIKSVNGYEPVDSAVLTDEELNRTLLAMVGPARAASVSEKPMKWSVRAEGVATLAVVAVRRGEGLSMRVMRTGDSPSIPPKPVEPPDDTPAVGTPALAAPEQNPAEPPVDPSQVVPPSVAPLIPPVRRPSVTGLRVIKAGSPLPPPPPPQIAPPPAVAPPPQMAPPQPPPFGPRLSPQTLEPLHFTPAGSIQSPVTVNLVTPPPVSLEMPASLPPVFEPPPPPPSEVFAPPPPPLSEELFEPPPPPLSEEIFEPPPPPLGEPSSFPPTASPQPPPPPAASFTPPLGIQAPPARPPPPIPTPAPEHTMAFGPPAQADALAFGDAPPPPPSEISSIDISIDLGEEAPPQEAPPPQQVQQPQEPEEPQEHTPPTGYRPALPPRTRPDFWRDLPALMEEARRIGASDLHIVSGRPALFRVAGELKPDGEILPPKKVEQLVLSQVPARQRAALDQEGSCDFAFHSELHGRFRVNVCRHRTGLKGSFRLLSRELPSLESLGLPLDLALATRASHGLILVTGPAGHGKSSTLAALVDILNRETKRHILTVEDPVEHVHPRKRALVSQREVGTHTRSFASALKGALREDADVIVVGELRDAETVRLALTASETGRLVLGTMNTPTAAKTLERLIELFPPAEHAYARATLASHVRLIVSQRLLPTANGAGLVVAAEVLPGSTMLGQVIRENELVRLPSLQQRGQGLGSVRIDEAMADLVRGGKTTLEIARGFAENPDVLESLVAGTAPELPPEPGSGRRNLSNPVGSLLGRKSA